MPKGSGGIPVASQPNRIVTVAALVVAAAMAAALLVEGWAARAVRNGDMETALALRPDAASALARASTVAFGAHRFGVAGALARAALEYAPLDVTATRTLGYVADRKGDLKRAAALMNQSARLSWRDTPTQAWLFRQALFSGDTAAIVQRGDALLRRNQFEKPVLAAFDFLATTDEGRSALAQTLAMTPPWRTAFLMQLKPDNATIAADYVALFDTLTAVDSSPDERESAPFLTRLVEMGYGPAAYALSLRLQGIKDDAQPLVTDPDFQNAAPRDYPSPFAWQLPIREGVQASAGVAPDGQPALSVEASTGGADVFAYSYVALPPGAYSISFSVYGETDGASDRLRGYVECAGSTRRLTSIIPHGASGRWGTANARFTVPEGCSAQRLRFDMLGGGDGETQLYIRQVAITPAEPLE